MHLFLMILLLLPCSAFSFQLSTDIKNPFMPVEGYSGTDASGEIGEVLHLPHQSTKGKSGLLLKSINRMYLPLHFKFQAILTDFGIPACVILLRRQQIKCASACWLFQFLE